MCWMGLYVKERNTLGCCALDIGGALSPVLPGWQASQRDLFHLICEEDDDDFE